MEVGMAAYETRYPDADVLLFEPPPDEYEMFFANVFAFAPRRAVCELAYSATRRDLRARREALGPLLARHGLALRDDVLDDCTRTVWQAAGLAQPGRCPLVGLGDPDRPGVHPGPVVGLGDPIERCEQALAVLGRQRPNLVLMDLQMPEMNGIELIKTLRTLDSKVKTIIFSSFYDEILIKAALKEGAKSYLPKGPLVQDLIAGINDV